MVEEVKQREVERFLEPNGWALIRTRGGHNVWKSRDGSQILAIPRHGMVTKGVVRQVIKAQPCAPDSWT
jgi:predicted RNA binding protein YcfA (HicA-like mRNA interferase family)